MELSEEEKILIRILNKEIEEKSLMLSENYIHKDKIREKMREIMGYTFTTSEERQCQNYAYDRLKELLEEE